MLGPVVAGWIADGGGYAATFAVSAVVCAAPVLAVLACAGDPPPTRTATGTTKAPDLG